MTGADATPPPEVPDEFAAAYRHAYAQALGGGGGADEVGGDASEHRAVPALLIGLVIATAAVLLIGAAFVIGRLLAHGSSASGADAAKQLTVGSASATCTAPPAQDASGTTVTYGAVNLIDDDPRTAWRCLGAATGVHLTLTLPQAATITEVGMIPGYAKTDPVSHADRYAEDNRVVEARWTIGDHTVVQKLDGSATNRSMQMIDVPATRTSVIGLEILQVQPGKRNITAISGVRVVGRG